MKTIFTWPGAIARLLLFALPALAIYGCDNPSNTSKGAGTDSTTAPASGKTTADAPKENWAYQQDSDKMTSKIKYYAAVNANEELQLKAPYDGGVTATLTIRNMGEKNEAVLSISKGQFLTGVNGENIDVRFDSLKAETYECSGPADYSTTTLFINSPTKFIAELKKAKKLLIQAVFFDNGTQQMEFNVDGFKWEK
jgi:hypothetical protein